MFPRIVIMANDSEADEAFMELTCLSTSFSSALEGGLYDEVNNSII